MNYKYRARQQDGEITEGYIAADSQKHALELLRGRNMIVINLDVMMAKRKVGLAELAGKVGITNANLSILKNNKAKAVRLETLDAICKALQCQPGDILEYVENPEEE